MARRLKGRPDLTRVLVTAKKQDGGTYQTHRWKHAQSETSLAFPKRVRVDLEGYASLAYSIWHWVESHGPRRDRSNPEAYSMRRAIQDRIDEIFFTRGSDTATALEQGAKVFYRAMQYALQNDPSLDLHSLCVAFCDIMHPVTNLACLYAIERGVVADGIPICIRSNAQSLYDPSDPWMRRILYSHLMGETLILFKDEYDSPERNVYREYVPDPPSEIRSDKERIQWVEKAYPVYYQQTWEPLPISIPERMFESIRATLKTTPQLWDHKAALLVDDLTMRYYRPKERAHSAFFLDCWYGRRHFLTLIETLLEIQSRTESSDVLHPILADSKLPDIALYLQQTVSREHLLQLEAWKQQYTMPAHHALLDWLLEQARKS